MEPVDLGHLDLATLAALAGDAASSHLLEEVRRHGQVRVSHGYVVQLLVGGTPTIGELAQQLGVTQQAASKSVVELERLGYVERVVDAGDSRVRRVRLTSQGRRVVADARRARARLEARLERTVGAARLEVARDVLIALLEEVGATDAVANRRVRPPT